MKKKLFIIDLLALIICALIIFSFALGIYVLPSQKFSEQENRALAAMPKFSWHSLTSGRYFTALSSFYADQIPLRTQMIKAKAFAELALGKQQNNSVIFLPSGHLIDRCEYEDTHNLFENLQSLRNFTAASGAICTLVPRSIDIYTDSSSATALTKKVYSYMGDNSLYTSLLSAKNNGIDVYYKTDHHLTSDGAYILYCQITEGLGAEAYPKSDFSEEIFTSDFLGSIYSKCGLICDSADTIRLYRYDGDTDYSVSCLDHGCTLSSLYDFSASTLKDKYRVFTGGNHGVLEISLPTDSPRPRLLLIKDSFANAVLPLLARHFDLTVYDPRYTDYTPKTEDFDLVAVVMGIDTLQGM